VADLLFMATTVAFFALAAGFVKVCDHIIGPDHEELGSDTASDDGTATLDEVGS
jgi:hypothetical protein